MYTVELFMFTNSAKDKIVGTHTYGGEAFQKILKSPHLRVTLKFH